ncbi:MAG: KH domain-containing protein [Candidatus Micrarchaeota archaeon]|nr:KH domain-containing protein [Candidatus Micrarchaeota archaeon]
METVRIPSERVGALLGKDGATKRQIEKACKVHLEADREGGVEISGEPLEEWKACEVVRAIGRGFGPGRAMTLLKEGVYFKIIDLKQILGTEKRVMRHKGRIIGRNGRTRAIIEDMSGAYVSVYGNTVSVIGGLGELAIAEDAIEKMINGMPHAAVYTILEKGRRRMKEAERKLWI